MGRRTQSSSTAPQTKLLAGDRGSPRDQGDRVRRTATAPPPRLGCEDRRRRLRVPRGTAFPKKLHAPLGAANDFGEDGTQEAGKEYPGAEPRAFNSWLGQMPSRPTRPAMAFLFRLSPTGVW